MGELGHRVGGHEFAHVNPNTTVATYVAQVVTAHGTSNKLRALPTE